MQSTCSVTTPLQVIQAVVMILESDHCSEIKEQVSHANHVQYRIVVVFPC